MKPGRTVAPATSTIFALGTAMELLAPTPTMRPSLRSSTASGIGADPVPSISLQFVRAMVPAELSDSVVSLHFEQLAKISEKATAKHVSDRRPEPRFLIIILKDVSERNLSIPNIRRRYPSALLGDECHHHHFWSCAGSVGWPPSPSSATGVD